MIGLKVALQAVNAVRGITDRSDFMEWEKDVKGYDGKYVITRSGEIYHVYPSGKRRQLRPYTKKRDYKAIIKLTDNNGKAKVYNYSRLVY